MFAVVDIAGFQETVRQGDKLTVPHLAGEVGGAMTFDKVLLLAKDSDVKVGTPVVGGASVEVTILKHGKTDKIRMAKFRRRKRYLRFKGHRQLFTEIEVKKIVG